MLFVFLLRPCSHLTHQHTPVIISPPSLYSLLILLLPSRPHKLYLSFSLHIFYTMHLLSFLRHTFPSSNPPFHLAIPPLHLLPIPAPYTISPPSQISFIKSTCHYCYALWVSRHSHSPTIISVPSQPFFFPPNRRLCVFLIASTGQRFQFLGRVLSFFERADLHLSLPNERGMKMYT